MKFVSGAWKILLAASIAAMMSACQTSQPEPEKTPAAEAAPAPAAEAAPAKETYDVVKGDNLWNISGKSQIYGNPYQWPLLYKANSDKIEDADLIHPGQSLTVARGMSSAEIDAAVHHAKTRGAWTLGVTEQSDKDYLAQ